MKAAMKGIVHGKTIELAEEPGFPDGQEVSVIVERTSPAPSPSSAAALESLRRAAGSWSEDHKELDRYLEWNRQQRKGSRLEVPE